MVTVALFFFDEKVKNIFIGFLAALKNKITYTECDPKFR